MERNSKKEIVAGAKKLFLRIIKENNIKTDHIAAVYITATHKLNKEFPAVGVRQCGFPFVPTLCSVEIDVPESLDKVIRILVLANVQRDQSEIRHIYLGKAVCLRPDLL